MSGDGWTTVALTLSAPSATFLTMLAMPAASIIADGSGGALGSKPDPAADRDPIKRVVGTGPWVLDRWAGDRALEFRRNEHFWDRRPELERLSMRTGMALMWRALLPPSATTAGAAQVWRGQRRLWH